MLRFGEDLGGRPLFDDHASAHHRDLVAQLPHDAEVVGDEEVGDAQLVPGGLASRSSTWRWIETSSDETASSQTTSAGRDRERARNRDPLALPAGELAG